MDQKYNTSFIPKKFLAEDVQGGAPSRYIKQRTLVGPGYFVAILIFALTVGASVFLFIYTRATISSIENDTAELQAMMTEVKPEDIAEFLELERQMTIARELLDNHIAVSELLHKLEEKTLSTVQYGIMDFKGDNIASSVVLGARTRALANVALQVREYENDRQLVSTALTRLEKDTDLGYITFDTRADILRELLLYNVAIREGRHGKSPVTTPARLPQPSVTTTTE